MKLLIALLIAVPTLIAILMFTIAGFAFINPAMPAAGANPVLAILCIIAGVIAVIPLIVAITVGLGNLIGSGQKKENKNIKNEN